MVHPSRIFALYLVCFLFSVVFFTTNPFFEFDLSYLFLPLLIMVIFLWRLPAVRYVGILLLILITAHIRISETQTVPLYGKYESNMIVVEEPSIIGKNQKIKAKNIQGQEVFEITTNQFPVYEFGDQLYILGGIKEGEKETFNSKLKKDQLSGALFYPSIERISVKMKRGEEAYFNLRKTLIKIKNSYKERISYLVSEPEAGLLAGIMLGSKADLSPDFLSALSRTGTMHIIALSGFNITILAEFMRLITKRLSKKASTFIPLVTIWAFVLATGFSASIIRAAIMGSLLIVGQSLGRRSDSLVAILLASSIMVFINPNILLYDIGFQLSFAATVGILFFAPRIERYFNLFGSYFGPILATTFAAQLFTWPITSYYFGSVSLIAPVVNFFILPFIPLVMLMGFITTSIGFISTWLASKLALVLWVLLAYFNKTISVYSNLRFASININVSSLSFMIGYYLILFDLILILKRIKKFEKATT